MNPLQSLFVPPFCPTLEMSKETITLIKKTFSDFDCKYDYFLSNRFINLANLSLLAH